MTGVETDQRAAVLLARQEIADVLYRYCRALGRMDRPLADTVWHPGGTADYGPGFRGTGAEFLDVVWAYHDRLESHSHLVSNVLVDVDHQAGTATSEAYVSVRLCGYPDGGSAHHIWHRGRYLDRFTRENGTWGIRHRVYVGDLSLELDAPHRPASGPRGTRDRSDPSYALLDAPPTPAAGEESTG